MTLVCSNKPKPSVQKGAKGNQFWKRDIHHILNHMNLTYCGVDASEWLTIEAELNLGDVNLCKRCKILYETKHDLG